jgi:Co/Zn/Cd efflux system component
MDCSSEEKLIRLKLENFPGIQYLEFDIPSRKMEVYHYGDSDGILAALNSLHLDTKLISSEPADKLQIKESDRRESRTLWQVLFINFFFFGLEILSGYISGSMGLVADSLDMLADSIVYGLALVAVGGHELRKKRIAAAAGFFQLTLAVLGFIEVIRRFLGFGEVPEFRMMIIISVMALIGNAACLYLLQRCESREAHMKASMIFTSTDVIVNIGVISAGVLVFLTGSKLPDLAVGTIVFVLVGTGAYRIFQLSK